MATTRAGVELESVEYRQDTETYRARYDQQMTSPSMAVVAALSEVTNTDPLDLEPLYNVVDTDVLNALVQGRGALDEPIRLSFSVEEYTITVSSNGEIDIAPLEDGRIDHGNEDVISR